MKNDKVCHSTEENSFSLTDVSVLSKIKLNGRPYMKSEGISLDFPASSIEFKADCSGSVYLSYEMTGDENRYFIVFVDGAVTRERQPINDSGCLVLAENLSQGEHNFKLVTDTDIGRGALVTFTKITLEGNLISNASKKPIIEFLGDSLSSGAGALCKNEADGVTANSTDNESSTSAYPYLVAQSLGYDYRIVSRKGTGLKAGRITPDFLDFYKSANWWREDYTAFTAQSPSEVDVVVINLGTNDVHTYKTFDTNNAEDIAKYSQYYAELVTKIGYKTDTKILFVAGVGACVPHNKAFDGAIKILNAAGYNNVYSHTAGRYMSGGALHPTAAEHKIVAEDILKVLKVNKMV